MRIGVTFKAVCEAVMSNTLTMCRMNRMGTVIEPSSRTKTVRDRIKVKGNLLEFVRYWHYGCFTYRVAQKK